MGYWIFGIVMIILIIAALILVHIVTSKKKIYDKKTGMYKR